MMNKIIVSGMMCALMFGGIVPAQAVEVHHSNNFANWKQFKKSPQAKCIRKRESRNTPWVVSSNGLWHGLYQFATPTWQNMGGTKYAPVASQATRKQQHKIAFKTWKRVGWSPWYHSTNPCY
jgi:hypothetical protein